MTDGDREKTVPWIQELQVSYPYAHDTGYAWVRAFNVFVYPYALLVDPAGVVVWAGHPKDLDEKLLKETLEGSITMPLPEWPAEAGEVKAAVLEDEFGKARKLARGLAEGKPELKQVADAVESLIRAELKGVRAVLATGDFAGALDRSQALRVSLGDEAPEAKDLGAIRDTVVDHPRGFAVVGAQRRVARIFEQLPSTRAAGEDLIAELKGIQKDYEGTIAAREAAMALNLFQRLIKSF